MIGRLRERPLELYVLYRAFSLAWAFMPFQVLYLQSRGLTLGDAFDLNVVFSLATVVLEVPTGLFADRHGRVRAMTASGVVMAGACVLFVAGHSFAVFALANAGCALAMTLASGADSAWLYDHLAAHPTGRSYARYEGLATSAKGIGNLAAVLVAGALYAVAPWSVFAFTGVLTLGAALLARALPESRGALRREALADDLARSWRSVVGSPRLATIVVFGAFTFVLLRLSLFTDQAHLELHLDELRLGPLALAASLLAAGKEVGGALVAATTGTLFKRVRALWIVGGLVALVVAVYAVMGSAHGLACVAAMVLLGTSFGLFSPLMRALLNRAITDSRDRATILSFESMARRVAFALASPLFGRAAEGASLHAAFTGTAYFALVLYAAMAAVALATVRRDSIRGSALVSSAG